MRKLEELLRQAKKQETIKIDPQFKDDLKKRILHSPPPEPQKGDFWWHRLSLLLIPALVSLTLFFYFYDSASKIVPADREQMNQLSPAEGDVSPEKWDNLGSPSLELRKDGDRTATPAPGSGTESGILSPLDKPAVSSFANPAGMVTGPATAVQPWMVLALLCACLAILALGFTFFRKRK